MIGEYKLEFGITPDLLSESRNIPEDISEQVNQLEDLDRYQYPGYPPGIFIDNVKLHTLRVVRFARGIDVEGIDQERMIRMLWVHDIPELIVGDKTIVEKDFDMSTTQLGEFMDEEEIAARSILNDSDFELWQQFDLASRFLDGEDIDPALVSPEALIAKIIDRLDGDVFFHHSLAEYVERWGMQKIPLPPEKAMTRLFIRYPQYIEVVQRYPGPVSDLAEELLQFALREVGRIWISIDQEYVPDVINLNRI